MEIRKNQQSNKYYNDVTYAMATVLEQRILAGEDDDKDYNLIFDMVRKKIFELENELSFYLPNSFVSKINFNAGKDYIIVPEYVYSVIKTCVEYFHKTNGAFDITIAPVVHIWKEFFKNKIMVSKEEIAKKLELVGSDYIKFNNTEKGIKLEKMNQAIDLGGIGKGYAADVVKNIYLEMGIRSAYVNIGGNIQLIGNKADGSLWNIGIQDPRGTRGDYIAVVKLKDKTIVTSGDYEKYIIKDGIRYHHIIDPRTGYPSDSGLIGVTVITGSSMKADILSTAVFIVGLEYGTKLLKENNADGIMITSNREVYVTERMVQNFNIAEHSKGFKFYTVS